MAPAGLPAHHVARLHTILSAASFITALTLGLSGHYKKIVKNSVAGYPQEFFPSVSATIGDWYPERNIFQILIAFTSGPRIVLLWLLYTVHRSSAKSETARLPAVTLVCGALRTLCCGGWVYVTSYDDHDVHDFFMIAYMVLNIPWMIGCVVQASDATRRKRIAVASMFFLAIIPMVYFFVQHQVFRVPGAYSFYGIFEWSLIVFDVYFDSYGEIELREADIKILLGSKSDKVAAAPKTDKRILSALPSEPEKQAAAQKEVTATPKTSIRFSSLVQYKPALSFASSVYLSYVFWSIFTSLIPTLFYFSVWELGISGHELALLGTLSPILLTIPGALLWIQSREGGATLQSISLLALAAYALDKPAHRLIAVFLGCAAAVLKQAAEWATADTSVVTGLGLMLSSLSKHANHSNNPIWPLVNAESGGWNKTGILLAVLAIYERWLNPMTQPKTQTAAPSGGHWATAAIPLGGLIFTLHSCLSDPSTLIVWSWTGYENSLPRGPLPHVHGALTLLAQGVGLLLAPSSFPTHPGWFLYGALSTAALFAYRNWLGYIGGLNLAVFAMSVTPSILSRAAEAAREHGPGRVYFAAMLVYALLGVASVWTVAYAFVPGGVYLRERTDLVLMAQIACTSLAFRRSIPSPGSPSNTGLSRAALALFAIASLLVTLYRTPSEFPRPFKPGPRILTAGIWTLHFGMDNEGRDSQRLVRDVVRDMELDVVGLLETDLHRIVFGNRDLTRVIIEESGYYVDMGPSTLSHTWGAVLLSKFPIVNSTHHLLPSPKGELAPAIEAVLDVFGTYVTVVVAHNGQEEDPLDRELQSTELARIMRAAPGPVIFLGYVVTKPLAARPSPYEILVEDGNVFDVDRDDWDRWCEYIFYRGLYRTAYARISRGKVTDTELQIARFVVPPFGTQAVDDSDEARYLRSFKEDLPVDHWFTMDYYQENGGKAGHVYHVFGTPLYYKLPA